jgi:hypothetical protein
MKTVRWMFMVVCVVGVLALCGVPGFAADKDPTKPGKLEMSGARRRMELFEKKVHRMHGQPFKLGYQEKDALKRIAALEDKYPNDPEVKKLHARARLALLTSKGETAKVDKGMLRYRENGKILKELFFKVAKEEWDAYKKKILATEGTITKPFPQPSWEDEPFNKQIGKYIILEDFEYPTNEFRDSGRQYVFVGSGVRGFYFVELSNRNWLGAYEALRRYRRLISSDMPEGMKWTIVGKITGLTMLVPQAGKKKTRSCAWGWTVEIEAIFVPERTFAIADASLELGGKFAGEDKMEEVKGPLYTVKSIPDDVTPERLTEIFATAIKEKNVKLYMDCIDPRRRVTPSGRSRCMYHWDWHQKRFNEWYCLIKVAKADVTVIQGFDEKSDLESRFLTEKDKAEIKKTSQPLVEHAELKTTAYDERGRQYGSPKPRFFRREEKKRWYITNYPQPF